MTKKEIIKQTTEYVKSKLMGEGSGHDWWHVYRVWKNAVHIGKKENADLLVVELAALLHDISDWKFNDGNEDIGPKLARKWLEEMSLDEKIICHVCDIIKDASFHGAGVKRKMKSIEGKIVQDADRLDAIGAIGIGRAFAYGGKVGRPLHNPDKRPRIHKSFDEYKKFGNTSTINHFYEKLLLLKYKMNTATGKKIAKNRHKAMETFLKQFYKEWDGKD